MNLWQLYRGGDLTDWEIPWRKAFEEGHGSVFQSFELCREWVRHFATDGRLRLWVLRRESAAPAVAAFTVFENRLAPLGHGLFDYIEPVGHASATEQCQLARQIRQWAEWKEMVACGIPEDSAFLPFWQGLAPEWRPFSSAPQLRAGLPLDAFDRQHHRLMHRLERQLRQGWRISRVHSPEDRAALLHWMLQQKEEKLRAQGQMNVVDEPARRWLQALIGQETDMAELWRLHRGAQTAAGLLTWLCPPVRSAYTISYSSEAAPFSPGMLLLCGVVRHTLAEGRHFDFLTGEQTFKLRLADSSRSLLRLSAFRQHSSAEVPVTAYDPGTESRVR